MRTAYRGIWRRLGRVEKTLLGLLVIYVLLRVTGQFPTIEILAALGVVGVALAAVVKWTRVGMRRAIWRLRNRLIVAYLFIAVVPIILIFTLAALSGYVLIGQMAAYFIRTELSTRERNLLRQAETLAMFSARSRMPNPAAFGGQAGRSSGGRGGRSGERPPFRLPEGGRGPFQGMTTPLPVTSQDPDAMVGWFAENLRNSFPNAQVLIGGRDMPDRRPARPGAEGSNAQAPSGREPLRYPAGSNLEPPSPAWGRVSGLVFREQDGVQRLYVWAHVPSSPPVGREVTVITPLTNELLAGVASRLGDVTLVMPYVSGPRESRIPKPVGALDLRVRGYYSLQVPTWNSPNEQGDAVLAVDSRVSAVLGVIFEQKTGYLDSGTWQFLFGSVTVLFLLVEIASLWAGIRITRTMTGAVHELYQGTQHIKEADFTYRIPVKGDDQLAELGSSFNTMTENLGQLIVVAKEKERLQSELEIAREVQNQLFPRDVPSAKTLELKGVCKPARVVSGDYYDFMSMPGSELAFAIGDVAGKGISAALLMATIQSTMRTQLGVANGSAPKHYSAASLVAQLNRQLYANTTPEKYATFYFAIYDEDRHMLTYTNAGHLPPILVRKGEVTCLNPTGTVVGAFPFAKYEEKTIAMEQGDLVVAYTDGIVEPENPYGEMFGENRLRELVLRYAYAGSSEIIARTMEAVNQWTASSELQDDMTMVVVRRI